MDNASTNALKTVPASTLIDALTRPAWAQKIVHLGSRRDKDAELLAYVRELFTEAGLYVSIEQRCEIDFEDADPAATRSPATLRLSGDVEAELSAAEVESIGYLLVEAAATFREVTK